MDPNAKVILKVMNLGCCDSCPKKVVKALRKLGIEDIRLEIDQGGTGTLTIGHAMVPPTRMVKEISKHVSKKTVIVPPPPPPPAPAPAPTPALTRTPTPAPSPTPTPFFTPSSSFNDSMASAWFCAPAAGHCPATNEPLPAPLAPQHVPHSSSSSSSSSGGGGGWTYSAGLHHPSPHYTSPQASYYPPPSLPPSRYQYYDNNFNLHYYRDENSDGPGGCNFW